MYSQQTFVVSQDATKSKVVCICIKGIIEAKATCQRLSVKHLDIQFKLEVVTASLPF